MKTKLLGLLVVGLMSGPMTAQAALVVNEGFDDISTLAGAGWVQVNASDNPSSPYFQGNPGVFAAASGAADSYIAANFLSGDPTISNWLMTPEFTFAGALAVDFMARVAGGGFLDTIEVWLSSSGASSDVADFTTFLGSYSSLEDLGWDAQHYFALTAAGSGRVGFRYFVADTLFDGNYIGIDSVTISTVPLPAAVWLLLSGLGGLGFLKRRKLS